MSKTSELEELFLFQLKCARLPMPLREFKFFPSRRWKSDFAWPSHKLLIEIEGGTYVNGRHNRASGYAKDCEKYNHAALQNYVVLRFVGEQVKNGEALQFVVNFFKSRGIYVDNC